MAAEEFPLPDFFSGMPLDHNDPQAIVDALRELQRYVGNTTFRGGPVAQNFRGFQVTLEMFFATVQSKSFRSTGFNDPTLTDCRYYFQRSIIDPSIAGNGVPISQAETNLAWKQTGVASNLAELPPNNTSSGSHHIPDGTFVPIYSAYLRSSPQTKIYWFDHIAFDGLILRCDLTQTGGTAGDVSTTCSFTYTAKFLGTTNVIGTVMSPEASPCRAFPMKVANAATKGLVYWHNGTPTLTFAYESTSNKGCT